jgi:5-methyltetrahydropteroyltriglutamate--homocysteine methyltransferase
LARRSRYLEQAQDDATELAIRDQEQAGLDTVRDRITRAFRYVPMGRLVAAPDCGMKYLSRDVAYAKLEALTEGARLASQRS